MNTLLWAVLAGGLVAFVALWWWIEDGSARMHMRQAIREVGPRGQVPPKRPPPPPQRRRNDPAMAGVLQEPDPERRSMPQRRRIGDRRRPAP